jgi:hypothetical protein
MVLGTLHRSMFPWPTPVDRLAPPWEMVIWGDKWVIPSITYCHRRHHHPSRPLSSSGISLLYHAVRDVLPTRLPLCLPCLISYSYTVLLLHHTGGNGHSPFLVLPFLPSVYVLMVFLSCVILSSFCTRFLLAIFRGDV